MLDESRGYATGGAERGEDASGCGFAGVAVPPQIDTDAGILSFFSTTAVFGTPAEVTLSEIAIESFFPADEATAAALRRIAAALTQSASLTPTASLRLAFGPPAPRGMRRAAGLSRISGNVRNREMAECAREATVLGRCAVADMPLSADP